MKKSAQVAYEGLLTAFTVVLIWLAGSVPAISWSGCLCAGVLPAVMLSKGNIRAGIMVYSASSILSIILVPSKKYAVAYILFFGIYSVIKYRIEKFNNLTLEWVLKLFYAVLMCIVLYFAIKFGFLVLGGRIAGQPIFIIVVMFLAGFVVYDIIFSKMIALFRTFFK